MTLEEAKSEWFKDQSKKIIREPNSWRIRDVWFTVDPNGTLICNTFHWEYSGHKLIKYPASFQSSPHNDWILV